MILLLSHPKMITFTSKDDVLTLLIHLGYLVYDSETKRVRIPNEEVRFEFDDLLQNAQHTKLAKLVQDSEKLLKDRTGTSLCYQVCIYHLC